MQGATRTQQRGEAAPVGDELAITRNDWNDSIARSLISAVVFGDCLLEVSKQPTYSLLFATAAPVDASVYMDTAALRFLLFFFVGWAHAGLQFFAQTQHPSTTFDFIGTLGLLMWLAGNLALANSWATPDWSSDPQELQAHFERLLLIDSLLVTLGGALYFWSARVSQIRFFATRAPVQYVSRLHLGLYLVSPALYMLLTSAFAEEPGLAHWMSVLLAAAPLYIALSSAQYLGDRKSGRRIPIRPSEVHFNSFSPGKFSVFQSIFLLATGITLVVPFVVLWPLARAVPGSMLSIASGCFFGGLLTAMTVSFSGTWLDWPPLILPILAVGQLLSFSALASAGVVGVPPFLIPVASASCMATFQIISLRTARVPLGGIAANPEASDGEYPWTEPTMHLLQMTLLLGGMLSMTHLTGELTQYGDFDFSTVLTVSAVAAGVAFVFGALAAMTMNEPYEEGAFGQ